MLIPRILRNDVPYVNVNHKRDFIHINDLMNAIDIFDDRKYKRCNIDIISNSHKLTDLIDYFKIDCEKKLS